MSALPVYAVDETAETPVCTCTELCTEGTVNDTCPVCAADSARCAGKAAETPADSEGEPKAETPVCTCTELCTEGGVNEACPVCAEDLTRCAGKAAEPEKEPEAPQAPACTCTELCTEGAVNDACPVCTADLTQCTGKAAEPEKEPEAPQAPACTCTEQCTEGAVNDACPVCTADLTQCAGKAAEPVEPQKQNIPAVLDAQNVYPVETEQELREAINAINGNADIASAVIELKSDIEVHSKFDIEKNITIRSADGGRFRITRRPANGKKSDKAIKQSDNNLFQVTGSGNIEEVSSICTTTAGYNLFALTANVGKLTLDSVILDGATASDAWYVAKPEEGETWTGEREQKTPYYNNRGEGSPRVIYKDQNGNVIPYAYEAVIRDMDGVVLSTAPMIQATTGTTVELNNVKVENIFTSCNGAVVSANEASVLLQSTEVTNCASSASALIVHATGNSKVDLRGSTHLHDNVSFSSSNHALLYMQSGSDIRVGQNPNEGTDDIVVENNIYHGNGLIGSYNTSGGLQKYGYGSITINSGKFQGNRWPTFISSNAWGCIVYVYDYVTFTMNGGSIENNYCGTAAIATHERKPFEGGEGDDPWKLHLDGGTIKNNVTYYCYNSEMDEGMGGKLTGIAFAQQGASTYIGKDMNIEGDLLILGGRIKNDAQVKGNVTVGEQKSTPALAVGNGSFTGAGHYDVAGWIGTIVMSGNAVDLSDDSTDGYYLSNYGNYYAQSGQCMVLMWDKMPVRGDDVILAPNGHSFSLDGKNWYNSEEEFKAANPTSTMVFRNTFEFFPNFARITVDEKEGVRNLQRNIVLTGTAEDKLALPACDWYRDNYDFDGWFYKGKLYQPGDEVQADSDKDFLAIWETADVYPYAMTENADGSISCKWRIKAEGADKNGPVDAKVREITPRDVKVDGVDCEEFPFEVVAVTDASGQRTYRAQLKEGFAESMVTVPGNEDVNDAIIRLHDPVMVRPAPVTIYMGGQGYEGTVDENGELVADEEHITENGFPDPGFVVELSEELAEKLEKDGKTIADLKLVYEDTDENGTPVSLYWNFEKYGGGDHNIYRITVPEGQSVQPVRMVFIRTVDGQEEAVDSDDFVISDYLDQDLKMKVYGERIDEGKVKVVYIDADGNTTDCSIFTDTATLTVRAVSGAPQDEQYGALTNDGTKVPADAAGVVAPDGTIYTINNSPVEVTSPEAKIALLFDEILEPDENSTAYVDKLVDRTKEMLRTLHISDGSDDGTRQYMARYLDLVDRGNGNVWLSAKKPDGSSQPLTVYWPLPEGTDKNTKFTLLHFKGLHRELTATEISNKLEDPSYTPDYVANLTVTDTHVIFETDGFSPFVLTWCSDEHEENPSGNSGNSGNPNAPTKQTPPMQETQATTYAAPEQSAATLPQTRDDSHPIVWVALMVASLGGLTLLAVMRKKRMRR
nr:DUF4366 domain-containing protein [uncultured Subdoligranulum sp.]